MIRIFKTRVGFDGWRDRELRLEFRGVEELIAVGSVMDDARAMGKQLGNRHMPDRGVQIFDVVLDAVVELELVVFAEFHDTRGRKAL